MRHRGFSLGSVGLVGALSLAAACGSVGETDESGVGGSTGSGMGSGTAAGTTSSGAGGSVAPSADPLAQLPTDDGGLVNVSSDLEALLEGGTLGEACEAYFKGAKDRVSMLRCGKAMFFYESFGTSGVPAALVDFLVTMMPGTIGAGMEKLGMVPDPFSTKALPLGIVPSAPAAPNVPAYAFSCASCHFGRLPDGRYAVGAPNHDYDYGMQNLAFALFPQLAIADAGNHDPAAVARVQPMLDELAATPGLKLVMLGSLLGLLSVDIPSFPADVQHHYASWKTGTMDFLIAPLPIDDGVHTVSKISALWSLPTPQQIEASGMAHAMLGWGGPVRSTMNFLKEFVSFGGGNPADWPEEKLEPLVAYLESLRAPANPAPPPADSVEQGRVLFSTKGCIGCHSGPAGSGLRTYGLEEIGTDPAIAGWLDADLDGVPCCEAPLEPGETLSHGIKSPRLVGAWATKRFLHNGSVDSLESLFCVDGPRGKIDELAYRDSGHDMTCDGLSETEKRALIDYLRAR